MKNNKHVSHSNKPRRSLQSDKNVVVNSIAKQPVTYESYDNVSNNNSSPHGAFGWLLWSGWNGCLNFQHHVVSGVGKGDVAKGVEVAKN